MVRFLLALVLASLISAVNVYGQDGAQARDLWDKAIMAKGGREQLSKVKTLRIWYNEITRNFLGIPIHRGLVNRLYVLPNKVWAWDDGLPPPFHLSVAWLDIDQDKRCTFYQGASKPVCGPAQQGSSLREGLTQTQYLYLMESEWVKPQPIGVSTRTVGGRKVEVVRTTLENKTIDYFLDRKTHLPVRVEVFYNGSPHSTLTVEFSSYSMIDGINLPTKQKSTIINFDINTGYNSTLFDRPPSIDAGPDAWKPVSR